MLQKQLQKEIGNKVLVSREVLRKTNIKERVS